MFYHWILDKTSSHLPVIPIFRSEKLLPVFLINRSINSKKEQEQQEEEQEQQEEQEVLEK